LEEDVFGLFGSYVQDHGRQLVPILYLLFPSFLLDFCRFAAGFDACWLAGWLARLAGSAGTTGQVNAFWGRVLLARTLETEIR
jgi:hypothetical protein